MTTTITDRLYNKWPPSMTHMYVRSNDASSAGSHLVAAVQKHILWGSCQVCGDNGTGKHYGVIACEGCKGFFKRSVRKNLLYSCRGRNECIVDKMHRNRCQKCRFAKCLKAGMKREAVQCERKPLIASSTAGSHSQVASPEEREDRGYVSECCSEPSLTPPPSGCTQRVPAQQEALDFLGPHHAEFKISIPSLGGIPRLSMDYIYEFATRLLFVSVEWTQSLTAFRSLNKADQISLLRKTWSDIFLLGVAQCIAHFPFSPLLALAASDLRDREGDVKPPPALSGHTSLFDKIITIKDLMFSFEKLDLDATEFAYLKAVVLFNSDPYTSVQHQKQVDLLQEQSHCGLKTYIDIKYPNNPGRFAKILLRLPAVRLIEKAAVEELFFAPLIGTVKIGNIMENIVTRSSSTSF